MGMPVDRLAAVDEHRPSIVQDSHQIVPPGANRVVWDAGPVVAETEGTMVGRKKEGKLHQHDPL